MSTKREDEEYQDALAHELPDKLERVRHDDRWPVLPVEPVAHLQQIPSHMGGVTPKKTK